MSLLIEDPAIKNRFYLFIQNDFKVPICKRCNAFFSLGFPKDEEALSDYLICVANNLICVCENAKEIDYLSSGDSSISIKEFYS